MIYTWKDIVDIDGVITAEEFPISGDTECNGKVYKIDEFYQAVAAKYDVDVDDILTYMIDNINFDPSSLPWGAEECGCYIDGIPEWTMSSRKNKTHPVVKAVQKRLYALGYTEVGEADGVAGPMFTRAVKRFQKNNNCFTEGNPD